MPDGVGTNACEDLRARGIPCLIISAYPTWLRYNSHPPSDWIAKPLEASTAVAAVRLRLTSPG